MTDQSTTITPQAWNNLKTYFASLKFSKPSPIRLLTTARVVIDDDRLKGPEIITYFRENVPAEAFIYKEVIVEKEFFLKLRRVLNAKNVFYQNKKWHDLL